MEIDTTALEKLTATMEAEAKKIAASLDLPEDKLEDVRNALISGVPLYQIYNMKESVITARYALARQLYVAGKYEDGETMFRWLCTYAHENKDHWMGLGACKQAQNDYEGAMNAYQLAAVTSLLKDPTPFYYLGLCALKLNNQEAAKTALATVLVLADQPEHAQILSQAKAILGVQESGA